MGSATPFYNECFLRSAYLFTIFLGLPKRSARFGASTSQSQTIIFLFLESEIAIEAVILVFPDPPSLERMHISFNANTLMIQPRSQYQLFSGLEMVFLLNKLGGEFQNFCIVK